LHVRLSLAGALLLAIRIVKVTISVIWWLMVNCRLIFFDVLGKRKLLGFKILGVIETGIGDLIDNTFLLLIFIAKLGKITFFSSVIAVSLLFLAFLDLLDCDFQSFCYNTIDLLIFQPIII